jgi:putative two-component system response regulator
VIKAVIAEGPAPVVLVVDDVRANRELIEGLLEGRGYDIRQAADGAEALEFIRNAEPDAVLLDIDMPGMDGITVCRAIKGDPVTRLIPVVLITAASDRETRIRGLDAGADDFLTKPFDGAELVARTRALLRDRALNKRLDATQTVLLAVGRAVEARDRYTIDHAERVGRFARELGREMGMRPDELDWIYMGGVLHDVGKIAIRDSILLKPGPLDAAEWEIMRTHPVEGERICQPLRSTSAVLPTIRHHHERFDGTGYPDRLSGQSIPLSARLVAIADAWDAMTSNRVYRPGLGDAEALRRLEEGGGTQWDGALVRRFVTFVRSGKLAEVPAA